MATYIRIQHSDHVSYFLDCGVELGDLTHLEANIIQFEPTVAQAVDAYFQNTDNHSPIRMAQIANVWLDNQDFEVQRLWYATHLNLLSPTYQSLKEYYDSLVMTRIEQGNEVQEVFSHLHGTDTAKRFGETLRKIDSFDFTQADWDNSKDLFDQHFNYNIPIRERNGMVYRVDTVRAEQAHLTPDRLVRQEQAKRILKRAYKMSERFGKHEEVRILFNNNSVNVNHPNSPFVYHFTLGTSNLDFLDSTAHGALIIKITDKDNQPLFSNCVFIKDTPSIDQFLAFSNFIKQGLENELLNNGNLYEITEEGYRWIEKLNIGNGKYQVCANATYRCIEESRVDRLHSTRPGKRIRQQALATLHTDLGKSETLFFMLPNSARRIKYKRPESYDVLAGGIDRTPHYVRARLLQKRLKTNPTLTTTEPTP